MTNKSTACSVSNFLQLRTLSFINAPHGNLLAIANI
jgi:hypothetical protein